MDINQAISNVLCAEDLFQLAYELEQFILLSNTINKNKSQHYQKLHKALRKKILFLYDTYGNDIYPYLSLTKSYAIYIYLFGQWTFAKGYKTNREELLKLECVFKPQKMQ